MEKIHGYILFYPSGKPVVGVCGDVLLFKFEDIERYLPMGGSYDKVISAKVTKKIKKLTEEKK